MSEFNDIGISRQLHRPRIRRLLTIGLAASALHCMAIWCSAGARRTRR